MTEKTIFFDKFIFPVVKGLVCVKDERKPTTDYLFVNEKHDLKILEQVKLKEN